MHDDATTRLDLATVATPDRDLALQALTLERAQQAAPQTEELERADRSAD